jgi:hypothetical protein
VRHLQAEGRAVIRELLDAVTIARERLDEGSDAYADEDIIRQLVTAVEASQPDGTLRGNLLETARQAALRALAADAEHPVRAREQAEVAKVALEALSYAPKEPAEGDEMPEGERAAALRLVESLRAQVHAHRRFLDELARTFEEARTDTAARLAARIRSHLDDEGGSS